MSLVPSRPNPYVPPGANITDIDYTETLDCQPVETFAVLDYYPANSLFCTFKTMALEPSLKLFSKDYEFYMVPEAAGCPCEKQDTCFEYQSKCLNFGGPLTPGGTWNDSNPDCFKPDVCTQELCCTLPPKPVRE